MMMLRLIHLGILVGLEVGEMVVRQTIVVVRELVCGEEGQDGSHVGVWFLGSG